MFLIVISKILGLFINTLTTEDKYSLGKRKKLPQPFEMVLSKGLNFFCQFLAVFPKSTSQFEHFEKKGPSHSLSISEIRNCEGLG